MKKSIRKLLTSLLAFCMLITASVVPAFAEEPVIDHQSVMSITVAADGITTYSRTCTTCGSPKLKYRYTDRTDMGQCDECGKHHWLVEAYYECLVCGNMNSFSHYETTN